MSAREDWIWSLVQVHVSASNMSLGDTQAKAMERAKETVNLMKKLTNKHYPKTRKATP